MIDRHPAVARDRALDQRDGAAELALAVGDDAAEMQRSSIVRCCGKDRVAQGGGFAEAAGALMRDRLREAWISRSGSQAS